MKIAIEPQQAKEFVRAVEASGGVLAPLSEDVKALIWTDYHSPDVLKATLESNPQLEWVQLPFAGVDAFADILSLPIRFTSAKGAYSEPVAEHVLALMLALGRAIPTRVRATSWGEKFAVSLYESKVLVIGGGGITEELVSLLQPFGTHVTVLRKNPERQLGNTTLGLEHLEEQLPLADFVVVAAALTPETIGLINARSLNLMKRSAFLVNVARGKHVVSADLADALDGEVIAGAAIDVTDPEPLPDGHRLWSTKNLIITPHTADTPAQVTRMFATRIGLNVKAYLGEGHWVGEVDPAAGY